MPEDLSTTEEFIDWTASQKSDNEDVAYLAKNTYDRPEAFLDFDELNKIRKPIKKINYENSGDEEIERGKTDLSFSYTKLDSNFGQQMFQLEVASEKLEDWRVLSSYSLCEENSVLDIPSLLPEGWSVLFKPDCKIDKDSANFVSKTIFLTGDPAAPATLLALLHEIGHTQILFGTKDAISEKYGEQNWASEGDAGKLKDLANHLRNERDSWAFALAKLKPFIGKSEENNSFINISQVKNFIHNHCLRSYTQEAREEIENGLKDFFETKEIEIEPEPDNLPY